MGDMADYLLEQIDWGVGEDWEQEQYDERQCREETEIKTCKFCGRNKLHWEQREDGWRLCDRRGIHKCPVVKL